MDATGSPGSARSRSTSASSGSTPGSLPDISYVSSASLIAETCKISTMDGTPCKKVQSDHFSHIEPPPGLENLNSRISDPDYGDLAPSRSKVRLPPGLDGTSDVYRSSARLQQAEMENNAEVLVQCISHCVPPAPPDYLPVVCRLQDRSMPPPPEAAPEQVLHRLPKSHVPPPPPCAPPRLSAGAQLWACAPATGMPTPPPPRVAAPEQALCGLSQISTPPLPPCAPPKLSPQAYAPAPEMSIPPPPPVAAPEQVLRSLPKSSTPPLPPCAPPKLSPQAQLLTCAPAPPNWSCESHIEESLVEFAVDSSTLLTVGSADHRLGTCKPCAFFHTKGCGTGQNCTFCHLCAPGEKKRRQKVKRAAVKMSTNNA